MTDPESIHPPAPRTWGFWATTGLSLVVLAGWLAAQVAVMVAFEVIGRATGGAKLVGTSDPRFLESGLVIASANLVSLPVGVGLLWLFAHLRRRGRAWSYLGLLPVRWRSVVLWSIPLLAYGGITELVRHALDLPSIPPNIVHAYETAGLPWLFLLAIVVAAPVFEELLFRGFFFEGLARSAVGPWGAIVLPAFVWAGMHVDYPAYEIAMILPAGLLLGLARWRTGSLFAPLVMHVVVNGTAAVQIVVAYG